MEKAEKREWGIFIKLLERIKKTFSKVDILTYHISNRGVNLKLHGWKRHCKCGFNYTHLVNDTKKQLLNVNDDKCPKCHKDNSFKSFIFNIN